MTSLGTYRNQKDIAMNAENPVQTGLFSAACELAAGGGGPNPVTAVCPLTTPAMTARRIAGTAR